MLGHLRFSVRQRLTFAVALLVALALLGTGAALYVVELRRIEQQTDASITHEFDEVRKSYRSDDTPDSLLERFLSLNIPDTGEIFWVFPENDEDVFLGNDAGKLAENPDFHRTVAGLSDTGGITELTAGGRTYRLGILPVVTDKESAVFAVSRDVAGDRAALGDMMVTFALLGALSWLIIVAFSAWLAGKLLQPLRDLRQTAETISDGNLSDRIAITGSDDLADLQQTFNGMLERLETSFTAQRQMLDDAGHELRTPLTILRGHLDVLDPADRDDVESTRALLTDEIDRMSRLVEDLLMLAKARRPDFVRSGVTSVSAVVLGVYERCLGLAERDWRFVEPEVDTDVLVDSQRITQALLQLAANAVRHTETNSTIVVGADVGTDTVSWWVHDEGPGIDPAIRESVFERFSQGATESAGFGLGLSIVAAIASAHGGTAYVADTAVGTKVVITVPMKGDA